jgi:sugar/nucleoside kinase (ribokinase family)
VRLLSHVDALVINDEEAMMLSGAHTVIRAASIIQGMGPKCVIIKRGEHGALMFNNGDTFYAPAYPLETVVDPTGAGDTFAGGFMGQLAATGDLTDANMRRAVVVGTLMASFCVEGFSVSRLATVDRDQLLARYRELSSLTRFTNLDL